MMRFLISLTLLAAPVALAQDRAPQGKSLAATFAELLPALAKADRGAQQKWQDLCNDAGAPGHEAQRLEACKLMAAKLDAKTPAVTKAWLLKQIERIGGEESIEPLTGVLEDKNDELRESAVRALANNPCDKATTVLVKRLGSATGSAKVGLLNALGHRHDPRSVSAIAKELESNDETTAIAAARALARFQGANSMVALKQALAAVKGAVRRAVADAVLAHADSMQKSDTAMAVEIYQKLNTSSESKPIRLAAVRGTIQTSGDKAGELILKILGEDDAAAKAVAVGQIESLSAGALKTLASSLDKLNAPNQVAVVTAIAARGDRTQVAVALSAAKSTDADVKRAGILALGRLGDATAVEFLLDVMSSKDPSAGIAAESLASLPADGVNGKLIEVLKAEKTPARTVALIGILERRKAVEAGPTLLRLASSENASVRVAAFTGLKTMPNAEYASWMVAALLKTEKGKEREAAEIAVVAVITQTMPAQERANPVLAVIKATSKDRAVELYPLLGRLGGETAQKLLREALAGKDREAAVVGLCNWPNASANADLLTLAEKGSDAEKSRAVMALIRINAVLIDRTPEERLATLGVLQKTMKLATREEERRALLEGIGFVRHIETLRYVVPYLDQPALAQSACKAVVELAHSKMLREPNKAEFAKPLDRVIAMCQDRSLVDRARQYKDGR